MLDLQLSIPWSAQIQIWPATRSESDCKIADMDSQAFELMESAASLHLEL